MTDLPITSITKLSELLKSKQISVVELTSSVLDRAKSLNPKVNSFITFNDSEAINQAKKADEQIASGKASPLCGIPFTLKDAYVTKNLTTTCASDVLKGYIPQYNATVYQKLLDQQAILIGKTNQDAWGHGSFSSNNNYGPVKNPYDLDRVSGGSSGGCAVSVATKTCAFSIGEDTGGSIRNPSSFCNVTGLKVTYGRVSRYGAIAYASSLDTVGPMATNAADCALVLESIAGADRLDASSASVPVSEYSKGLNHSIKDVRVAVIDEFFKDGLDSEVKKAVEESIKQFEKMGANITSVSIPTAKYGVAIYYILAMCETSSNLARYDSVRFGQGREHFTPETKRRIMTGTFALSSGYYDAYYKKAVAARALLIKEFDQAFQKADVLIGPVMPYVAPKTKTDTASEADVLQEYLADLYTCVVNPVGVPSVAFPVGFNSQNLPIGAQLIGPKFSESKLLNLVHQYQQITNWHEKEPKV
jgi:aspartyl-tRNA(Asn)/glutamyl-tRNA(Gln) amidotransferase subunit A